VPDWFGIQKKIRRRPLHRNLESTSSQAIS
jgi:hypothetical protein